MESERRNDDAERERLAARLAAVEARLAAMAEVLAAVEAEVARLAQGRGGQRDE